MVTEVSKSLYAGLDLHKRNVFSGIKDQERKPIYRQRLPAELPTILQALDPYRSHLKAVAVESTFNWYWWVDGLQAAGYPVRLANPAGMEAYSGLKQTNDESDLPVRHADRCVVDRRDAAAGNSARRPSDRSATRCGVGC